MNFFPTHISSSPRMTMSETQAVPRKRVRRAPEQSPVVGPAKLPSLSRRDTDTPDIEDLCFTREEAAAVRESLLLWYDVNKRDLPWRRKAEVVEEEDCADKRAYGVWVSEVMLQQTRVRTVVDYYRRWMARWPSLELLASASVEEVNEMWAGLGYYRRARFLLEGAKMISSSGEGFPRTVAALRKVPGIGDYTAGAIASIAFNEVVPVVDGNVMRVIARLKAITANPKESSTVKKFWKLASELVDSIRPGDFNQSLMELGATVCTPVNPNCCTCPVSSQCSAFSISGRDESVTVTDYPMKAVKSKQREEFSAVSVVEILRGHNSCDAMKPESGYLLVKRPEGGLLAGLWEFPSATLKKDSGSAIRKKAVDRRLREVFGLDSRAFSIVSREEIGDFVHIFTHIRLKIWVEYLVLRLKDEEAFFSRLNEDVATLKVVNNEALSTMGLTSGVKKVYSMVQKFKQNICRGP
ncbi:hypothetical protein MLD38_031659 [Melastoma candidum]|uniref:Uncharacterized protein n=1 Tax=Melastoma candidum TaxID=119954 RepID=A0ACB9MSD4_9MYRT|nr:hypothetical protein MLD38_031659 [Melastoma candidum]